MHRILQKRLQELPVDTTDPNRQCRGTHDNGGSGPFATAISLDQTALPIHCHLDVVLGRALDHPFITDRIQKGNLPIQIVQDGLFGIQIDGFPGSVNRLPAPRLLW